RPLPAARQRRLLRPPTDDSTNAAFGDPKQRAQAGHAIARNGAKRLYLTFLCRPSCHVACFELAARPVPIPSPQASSPDRAGGGRLRVLVCRAASVGRIPLPHGHTAARRKSPRSGARTSARRPACLAPRLSN